MIGSHEHFRFFFRIRTIENLDALTNLDVLDLHGNKVSGIVCKSSYTRENASSKVYWILNCSYINIVSTFMGEITIG